MDSTSTTSSSSDSDLEGLRKAKPPQGFVLGPLIDIKLINELKSFVLHKQKHTWLENEKVTRSTVNYGWDYAQMEQDIFEFVEITPLLKELREKLYVGFREHLKKNILVEEFDNVIVTIYEPGQFLIPHYDADNSPNPLTKRNFYFEEPILGTIIEADPSTGFTFYYYDQKGRPGFDSNPLYQVEEKAGSTFLLQGPCRHAPYFHAIPPTARQRISITMRRTVLPDFARQKK